MELVVPLVEPLEAQEAQEAQELLEALEWMGLVEVPESPSRSRATWSRRAPLWCRRRPERTCRRPARTARWFQRRRTPTTLIFLLRPARRPLRSRSRKALATVGMCLVMME